MNKYLITCTVCNNADFVVIDKSNQIFWNNNKSIVSGRKRLDGSWGWQCICGNNSIMTQQEQTNITNKQSPDPREVEKIIKNPIPDKVNKFRMEKQ